MFFNTHRCISSKTLFHGLLALAMFSLSPSGNCATYTVDKTNGDDSRKCSNNAIFKTIKRALECVVANQANIIAVSAGTYNERRTIAKLKSSKTAPLVIQGPGNGTEKGPQAQTKGFVIRGDYVTIKGLNITVKEQDENLSGRPGIQVEGDYNQIRDNYIHDLWGEGIFIENPKEAEADNVKAQPTHNTIRANKIVKARMAGIHVNAGIDAIDEGNTVIDGNEISDTVKFPDKFYIRDIKQYQGDADGIRFFGRDLTISNNCIHDIRLGVDENIAPSPYDKDDTYYPHIDCFQSYARAHVKDIRIERNTCFNDNKFQAGLYINNIYDDKKNDIHIVRDVSNLVFRNNVMQAWHGVKLYNDHNSTIANNTLLGGKWRPGSKGFSGNSIELHVSYLARVYNNFMYNHNTYSGGSDAPYFDYRLTDDSIPEITRGLDKLVAGSGNNVDYDKDGPQDLNLWTDHPLPDNMTRAKLKTGDPHLAGPLAYNFRPTGQSSYLINDGSLVSKVGSKDRDYNDRPDATSGQIDVGAYEYNSGNRVHTQCVQEHSLGF
jgi:hypothetical protein